MSTRVGNSARPDRVGRFFGITDSKGRRVGALVWLGVGEFIPAVPGRTTWSTPVGSYFTARPSATRDSYEFGPAQRERFFATARERDAWVEKYFAGAERRAIKSHGPADQI